MEGRNPPRHEGIPECGYYSMRDVSGGPYVPVRIELEADVNPETGELEGPERFVAIAGEDERRNAVNLWTRLDPISKEEYDRILAANRRATRVKVDLTKEATRPR
jgi:hypothetical protein